MRRETDPKSHHASAQVAMHEILPGDLDADSSEVKVQKGRGHAGCTHRKVLHGFFIERKIFLMHEIWWGEKNIVSE